MTDIDFKYPHLMKRSTTTSRPGNEYLRDTIFRCEKCGYYAWENQKALNLSFKEYGIYTSPILGNDGMIYYYKENGDLEEKNGCRFSDEYHYVESILT